MPRSISFVSFRFVSIPLHSRAISEGKVKKRLIEEGET